MIDPETEALLKAKSQNPDSETQTKIPFDSPTLYAAAMLVNTNGYMQHGMTGDTRLTKEERAARSLCSRICEGMARALLTLDGSTKEQVDALMKQTMVQIQARQKATLQ